MRASYALLRASIGLALIATTVFVEELAITNLVVKLGIEFKLGL